MRITHLGLLAMTAVAFATPASAQLQDKDEVIVNGKRVDPDAKSCKRMDPPVGSRLGGRRVCKTNAQWAAEQAAAREAMQDTQTRGAISDSPTSPGG